MQYQSGTGVSTVEKPAETQTSIRLAYRLVKAPNSRFGGHEFESPMRRELRALTKSGKILGVRYFYNTQFIKIGEDCPQALVRILFWGRGKSGKTPGWEQVHTYELAKILEEVMAGEDEYPRKLLPVPANRSIN
jgi:hypothetical protein